MGGVGARANGQGAWEGVPATETSLPAALHSGRGSPLSPDSASGPPARISSPSHFEFLPDTQAPRLAVTLKISHPLLPVTSPWGLPVCAEWQPG